MVKSTISFITILFLCTYANTHDVEHEVTELDHSTYPDTVGTDNYIWVIKIASKMCSGCKEFKPHWEKFAQEYQHANFGVVYVDDPDGMKLVQKFEGILDKGLPAVVLIKSMKLWDFTPVVEGKVVNSDELGKILAPHVKDLKQKDGMYYKVRVPKSDL